MYIWPDNNTFLVEGIRHHFGGLMINIFRSRLSSSTSVAKNINYFYLKLVESVQNARLILVTDKKMTAIAHYWFYNDVRNHYQFNYLLWR